MSAPITSRPRAALALRELAALYGLRWDAKVPAEAYERLQEINKWLLTREDRTKALRGEI